MRVTVAPILRLKLHDPTLIKSEVLINSAHFSLALCIGKPGFWYSGFNKAIDMGLDPITSGWLNLLMGEKLLNLPLLFRLMLTRFTEQALGV